MLPAVPGAIGQYPTPKPVIKYFFACSTLKKLPFKREHCQVKLTSPPTSTRLYLMKNIVVFLFFSSILSSYLPVFAVETAPRISDKEIIEGLSDIRGEIKSLKTEIKRLDERFESVDKRFDVVDKRFDVVDKRFDVVDKRFDAVDKRFDDFHWMFSMFITIALAILGFVVRMQWQMNKKQAQMETSLETQKDELSFLKGLIEKLILPRGAL